MSFEVALSNAAASVGPSSFRVETNIDNSAW